MMLRTLFLLLVGAGALWLVCIFGIGMLISFLALAAAAVLLPTGRSRADEATPIGRPTTGHTTHLDDLA
jgi:hypothetical protein